MVFLTPRLHLPDGSVNTNLCCCIFMQDKEALSSFLIILPKCTDALFHWADMQNTDTDGSDLTHCFLRSGLLLGTFFQFVPKT